MYRNGDGKPLVALDIDGTLGDYHGHFLNFAALYFGRAMPDPKAINPGLKLWEFMEIDQHSYREAKLAYRQGGWKRWMPAYLGAGLLTERIRLLGAEVWICTTRPYLRLDNIDPDTQEWLRRNGIQFDGVIYDSAQDKNSKYKELARQAGSRVCAVVDDLSELWIDARQRFPEATIILRDQPYNQDLEEYGPVVRACSCEMIWREVSDAIRRWKEENEWTE